MTNQTSDNVPFEKKTERLDIRVSHAKKKAFAEAWRVLRTPGKLIVADMHTPTTRMGALVSHVSRWFFLQPQIGENIRGVLPALMEKAGFERAKHEGTYFGYIAIFSSRKP